MEHGGWRLNRNKWDAAQRVPTIGLTIRFEHAFGHPPTAGPGRFSIRFKPAQEAGKRRWYADYQLRVAKVERAYAKTGRAQGQSVEFEIRLDDLSGPEIAGLLAEHLRCMAEVSPPAAASRTFQRGAVAN